VKDAILDGEIICLDNEGVSVFNELSEHACVTPFRCNEAEVSVGSLRIRELIHYLARTLTATREPELNYDYDSSPYSASFAGNDRAGSDWVSSETTP